MTLHIGIVLTYFLCLLFLTWSNDPFYAQFKLHIERVIRVSSLLGHHYSWLAIMAIPPLTRKEKEERERYLCACVDFNAYGTWCARSLQLSLSLTNFFSTTVKKFFLIQPTVYFIS